MSEISSSSSLKLSYRVRGNGSLPVIFLHGWMMSGAVFDTMLPWLPEDGLRLMIPDQRGTAGSYRPASDYSLDHYVQDILDLAEAERVGRFVLIGHSMGGQIAQLIAARHAERVIGMVLMNPVPAAGMALPEDAKALFRASGGNREAQETILKLACLSLTDEERSRLLDDAGRVLPACVTQAFDTWTKGGFVDELVRIKTPTLVLATDDPFMPPSFLKEAVADKIGGARMAVLPGCGHYPQCERPRETAAILSAFFCGLR